MRLARRSAALAAVLLASTPLVAALGHELGEDETPVLTPAQTMASYKLPAGYRLELVAAEPLVQDPVAVDFDADGRMWVVEMRGFMPNLAGTGELRPVGRNVVLEDTNDDGRMDKSTVFLDSLVLPRSVKVLTNGVLVAAPPNLWLVKDTNGDLRADSKELVRDDYGQENANPEHNANGLVWGMDNWIHNANYEGQFRVRGGRIEFRKAPAEGQWGLSMDSHGRFYRNSNEDPLHVDLVSEHYAARSATSASATTIRGLYEELTPNTYVWPAHATPAVNRGYQPQVLRADSSLQRYTSASSPTAYVGDRLPAELRDNVFVTEPAGNLVGRFIVTTTPDGMLTATSGPERPSFLAATDTRSRPVFTTTAPDGTLYVVDMYRGIIQHRTFITGYLETQIKSRGLEQPVGLGLIYRVVHTTTKRAAKPHISRASTAQLVETLKHPNGWWRITAQRLLVEHGDKSAVPALKKLARTAPSEITRLHALWTLDGLAAADASTIDAALRDNSADVRAAAVRIAEPQLAKNATPVTASVLHLVGDTTPVVRRQLAASLGELPAGDAREQALANLVARSGSDVVVADMVVTGLSGREAAFLEKLAAQTSHADVARAPSATVRALANAVIRTRDSAGVERVLALATEDARPRWQRLALLEGLQPAQGRFGFGPQPGAIPADASARPAGGAGGGRRGGAGAGAGAGAGRGAGRFGGGGRPTLNISATPTALLALAESGDSALSAPARRVAGMLMWPGKPRPAAPEVRPLTPEEQARYTAGQQQFTVTCQGCHQANGQGLPGVAKSLVGSRWALSAPAQVIRIVLHGKEGEMLMPPVGKTLSDEQIANVLTYVRRSWGNQGSAITPAEVYEIRGATMGRDKAWTEAELEAIRR
jgi:mono/diheme cytochrome c family protein